MGGIKDFLDGLDLDQLGHAKSEIDRLIAKKNAEPKHRLWMVSTGMLVLKYFPGGDYVKAAEWMLDKAKENEASHAANSDKQLELTYIVVGESEVASYLSHNR
ncbi:MAG: hypothetical protein PHU14_05605 [Methylovulum sp.]|nr:hypothetical protein [Methylovulum sp.]